MRQTVLCAISLMALVGIARGQSLPGPTCGDPDNDYLLCALQAGGVQPLENVTLAPGERELRFWIVSGLFEPDRVLVIHQRGDSVTGRLLLIWGDSVIATGGFAKARCADLWLSPSGSLCIARQKGLRHWSAVLRQLDSLGLALVPADPVGPARCNHHPPAVDPGTQVTGWTGCTGTDGFDYTLELRTSAAYWRYQVPRIPDSTATGMKRDAALFHLLECAARNAGDDSCR